MTAAEGLLVEIGYARSSTNVIAKRAGVSVGSLYQYFATKDEVFRAVARRHREQVLPHVFGMLEALADPAVDIADAAIRLMRQMAQVHGRNPELMRAIEGEIGWLEHEDDGAFEVTSVVVEVLRKRSYVCQRETDAIAALLVEVVSHLSRWLVHSRPPGIDLEPLLAATHRMLRGLLETSHFSPPARVLGAPGPKDASGGAPR